MTSVACQSRHVKSAGKLALATGHDDGFSLSLTGAGCCRRPDIRLHKTRARWEVAGRVINDFVKPTGHTPIKIVLGTERGPLFLSEWP